MYSQTPKTFSKTHPTVENTTAPAITSQFILKKFLSNLTKKGKQIKAEKLLKRVFLALFLKRFSPMTTIVLAINNVKPFVEVRTVKIKGKSFQVPFPIRLERQISLSIKIILKSSMKDKNFESRLVEELIGSALGKSSSVKHTVNLHKTAFQNRLSTNYRWF